MCLTVNILNTCFRGLLGQLNANMYELQIRQRQHLKGWLTILQRFCLYLLIYLNILSNYASVTCYESSTLAMQLSLPSLVPKSAGHTCYPLLEACVLKVSYIIAICRSFHHFLPSSVKTKTVPQFTRRPMIILPIHADNQFSAVLCSRARMLPSKSWKLCTSFLYSLRSIYTENVVF